MKAMLVFEHVGPLSAVQAPSVDKAFLCHNGIYLWCLPSARRDGYWVTYVGKARRQGGMQARLAEHIKHLKNGSYSLFKNDVYSKDELIDIAYSPLGFNHQEFTAKYVDVAAKNSDSIEVLAAIYEKEDVTTIEGALILKLFEQHETRPYLLTKPQKYPKEPIEINITCGEKLIGLPDKVVF
jgi:hypothetical protein